MKSYWRFFSPKPQSASGSLLAQLLLLLRNSDNLLRTCHADQPWTGTYPSVHDLRAARITSFNSENSFKKYSFSKSVKIDKFTKHEFHFEYALLIYCFSL